MSQIGRYLKILSLSDLILKDMEKSGAVEDTQGHENMSVIRLAAFAQLIRDGMPADFENGYLTIEDSGQSYKVFLDDIAEDYLDIGTLTQLLPMEMETVRTPLTAVPGEGAAMPDKNTETYPDLFQGNDDYDGRKETSQDMLPEAAENTKEGKIKPAISGEDHKEQEESKRDSNSGRTYLSSGENVKDDYLENEARQENISERARPQGENRFAGLVQARCTDQKGTGNRPVYSRDDMQFSETDVTVMNSDGEEDDLVQLYMMPIADKGALNLLIGSCYPDDYGTYHYNVYYGSGSMKIPFGKYSVICRGTMENGKLKTDIRLSREYAQQGYSIQTDELRYDGGSVHTHPYLSDGSGFDAHLLPLESKNNSKNTADYFAVIFDGDDTVTTYNIDRSYAEVPYHGQNVGLAGKWNNKELAVTIGMI